MSLSLRRSGGRIISLVGLKRQKAGNGPPAERPIRCELCLVRKVGNIILSIVLMVFRGRASRLVTSLRSWMLRFQKLFRAPSHRHRLGRPHRIESVRSVQCERSSGTRICTTTGELPEQLVSGRLAANSGAVCFPALIHLSCLVYLHTSETLTFLLHIITENFILLHSISGHLSVSVSNEEALVQEDSCAHVLESL